MFYLPKGTELPFAGKTLPLTAAYLFKSLYVTYTILVSITDHNYRKGLG